MKLKIPENRNKEIMHALCDVLRPFMDEESKMSEMTVSGRIKENNKLLLNALELLIKEELAVLNSKNGCGKISAGDEICGDSYLCKECVKAKGDVQK